MPYTLREYFELETTPLKAKTLSFPLMEGIDKSISYSELPENSHFSFSEHVSAYNERYPFDLYYGQHVVDNGPPELRAPSQRQKTAEEVEEEYFLAHLKEMLSLNNDVVILSYSISTDALRRLLEEKPFSGYELSKISLYGKENFPHRNLGDVSAPTRFGSFIDAVRHHEEVKGKASNTICSFNAMDATVNQATEAFLHQQKSNLLCRPGSKLHFNDKTRGLLEKKLNRLGYSLTKESKSEAPKREVSGFGSSTGPGFFASSHSQEANPLLVYTQATRTYIEKLENQAKNSQTIEQLNLNSEEERGFDECRLAKSGQIPNIPVRVHGILYDLESLLHLPSTAGFRMLDPNTSSGFYLRDIQPAFDIQQKIEAKIRHTIAQRQDQFSEWVRIG